MDGLFGVGPLELIIVVALALVVLGPERLPGVIREIVKFVRQTRAIGNELTAQFRDELHLLDDFNPNKMLKEIVDLEEEIDAKELLGIDKDDLKLDDVNLDIKDNKSSTKKSSTSSTNVPSTAPLKSAAKSKAKTQRTKPALGETDPEETVTTDAVTGAPSDTSDDTKLDDNGLANEASEEAPAPVVMKKSSSASSTTDASTPEEQGIAVRTSNLDNEEPSTQDTSTQDASAQDEQHVENRIAPPSMTNAQSLLGGKAAPTKPQNGASSDDENAKVEDVEEV